MTCSVSKRNARKRYKIIKFNYKNARTTSGVFIDNFERISHLFLVFLLLTLKVNDSCVTSISLKLSKKLCGFLTTSLGIEVYKIRFYSLNNRSEVW